MLNMSCQLCGRQQVWGLMSSAAWGADARGEPTVCPECKDKHPDWQDRIAEAVGD
jgi:hypothetical protein